MRLVRVDSARGVVNDHAFVVLTQPVALLVWPKFILVVSRHLGLFRLTNDSTQDFSEWMAAVSSGLVTGMNVVMA